MHNVRIVADKVEVVLLEARQVNERGPLIRIVHGLRMPGTRCMPGEQVLAVALVHRGREFDLNLSVSLMLLFDYLARYCHLPQSSRQIEAGIMTDPFCVEHGSNTRASCIMTRRITQRSVKVYIERLRRALATALDETKVQIEPRDILVSQSTQTNEVGYKLRARTEWVHLGFPGVPAP